MLRAAILGVIACLVIPSWARAVIVLNFDSLPATSAYSNGSPVPAGDRLSNQYVSTNGILFSSNSPYVAVGQLGAAAPSQPNAIAGTSAAGNFDYSAPVTFSFWNPANPSQPAVTDFFSIQADTDGNGGGVNVTVSGYDVNGNLVGSNTELDTGSETWTLAFPSMHSIVFPGTTANPSFGGIALDNATFDPVTPVPEPVSAVSLGALALLGLCRQRR